MKIRPLRDNLVVQREEEDTKTTGGIILPDTAKEKPSRGKVIAAGEGKYLENGQVRKPVVKVGDRVLFGKYAGTEVTMGEAKYIVMREEDVMGIIE